MSNQDLATNLDAANQAVRHVARYMTIGSSNKWGDMLASGGGGMLCVVATRSVEVAVPRTQAVPSWIREMAAKAQSSGCGNCGEQAAIAYIYLVETAKIAPLDYMSRVNADHAFIAIGRIDGSDAADYSTWGPSAVVCDPWDGEAYQASEIPTRMPGRGLFAPETLKRYSG